MNATKDNHVRQISTSSCHCHLAVLFGDTVRNGQISFTDWYELMTMPLDSSFSTNDEDIINRLIYGVHRGILKIVDTP